MFERRCLVSLMFLIRLALSPKNFCEGAPERLRSQSGHPHVPRHAGHDHLQKRRQQRDGFFIYQHLRSTLRKALHFLSLATAREATLKFCPILLSGILVCKHRCLFHSDDWSGVAQQTGTWKKKKRAPRGIRGPPALQTYLSRYE